MGSVNTDVSTPQSMLVEVSGTSVITSVGGSRKVASLVGRAPDVAVVVGQLGVHMADVLAGNGTGVGLEVHVSQDGRLHFPVRLSAVALLDWTSEPQSE